MSLQSTLDEMNAVMGTECFIGDWIEITQEQINMFAESTTDKQWIHVDPERAKNSPFGKTIAHGFLTLSHIPYFAYQIPFEYKDSKFRMNYGLDKVRFLAPVPVGSRIRDRIVMKAAEERPGNKLMMITSHTFEIEGSETPACVADLLAMIIF